jgi:hypothetical protein
LFVALQDPVRHRFTGGTKLCIQFRIAGYDFDVTILIYISRFDFIPEPIVFSNPYFPVAFVNCPFWLSTVTSINDPASTRSVQPSLFTSTQTAEVTIPGYRI